MARRGEAKMKSGFNSLLASVFAIVAYCSLTSPTHARESEPSKLDRQTYVLVHGAWGGGWAFRHLANLLEKAGHTVYRPTMTGLGERVHLANPSIHLETHIQDIINVIEFEELRNVILVGHSYGGMVISGVATRIPKRLACLIYIDAHVPENGESMFDLIAADRKQKLLAIAHDRGDNWLVPPPWPNPGKDMPHPLATFQDPVKVGKLDSTVLPGHFVWTVEPGSNHDDFSESASRARNRGWRVYKLPTGHNPHWSMPEKLSKILLEAGQL